MGKNTHFAVGEKHKICATYFMNRLRHIRKNVLRLSSIEKLADLLGGEAEGWYQQKLQRLETGKTRMTEADAFEMAAKLQQAGYDVEAWHFFTDPEQHERAMNEREKALLETYRGLSEQEQQIYLNMGEAFIKDKHAKPEQKKVKDGKG